MFSTFIKSFVYFILIFGNLSTAAQSDFTLLGYGQKLKDGDSLFLAYRDNGKFILKSTVVKDQRFLFEGTVKSPVKAYISRKDNPAYAEFITEGVDVFLEPGKILINSPDTLTGAVLSGTELNETLQQFQNEYLKLKERRRAIKDPDFFTEEEKKDTALVNRNKKQLLEIFYEDADNKLAFANKHPNSFVSLDMLYTVSRLNDYIFKVEEVFQTLSDELKQTDLAKVIVDRIQKKSQLLSGMKAFNFVMSDNKGKTVDFSSFRGQYVLLDFWAAWCGPCREEHPNLIKVYEKYKNKGFNIVSISIDTNKEQWLKAIEKDKITWTQLSDLKGDKGEVYLKYGITSIPANFLIAPDGTVVAKDLRSDKLLTQLEEVLK